MKVAVVILNWNKSELTRHCLAVARRSTELSVHWIIVDNGSSPPFKIQDPDVTLLRNATNAGFAGGTNTGLRYAFENGADSVWVLNNDAEALPGALDALVAAVGLDNRVGLASSVVLDSDLDDRIDWHGSRLEAGEYVMTSDPQEYQRWEAHLANKICLMGTALLVTRTLIQSVGYFDEAFFAYWEDVDISRRSMDAGLRNIVVPTSFVRHPGARIGSGNRPPYYYYYMIRNQLLLFRKFRDPIRAYYWAFLRFARWYTRPELNAADRKAIRRGILHGLLRIGGPHK